MSNANRKAKPTTMVDKKLKNAENTIAILQDQMKASAMQTLNMRQMYEASVQEKQALKAQLDRCTNLVMGIILQSRGKTVVLKEKTFGKLSEFIGFRPVAVDGDLHLTLVTQDDLVEQYGLAAEEQADDPV